MTFTDACRKQGSRAARWAGLAAIILCLNVSGTAFADNILPPLAKAHTAVSFSFAAPDDTAGHAAAPAMRPALQIRPRQAGDFLDSLGLSGAPADATQARVTPQTTLNHAAATPVSLKHLAATDPAFPPMDDDPLEPLNRLAFGFNMKLQDYILNPVATYYLEHTTKDVRAGVRNFFANLREPLSIASYALEGDMLLASNATARFAINTTFGVVGVYDKAAQLGYPKRVRDLEATICAYGVPAGPYVVLPVLGPATIRDGIVRITTMAIYMEAMGLAVYVPYRGSSIAAQYADIRDKQEYIESISLDPYVAYRMLYLQMRKQTCSHPSGEDQYFIR